MDDAVECAIHGEALPYGFVCTHLQARAGTGWHDSETDELCPDAWCDACERTRVVAGGWTDEAGAAADIKLICACCYHLLRGRRLTVPELDVSTEAAALRRARHEMQHRNDAMRDTFSTGDWWFDLDAAELEFRAGTRPLVRCGIVAIGSYSERSGTWLSASRNRDIPAISSARSAAVEGYLTARGFEGLAASHVQCALTDAWGRAAVGAMVLSAVGLYRCPSEGLHLFLALLDARPVPI